MFVRGNVHRNQINQENYQYKQNEHAAEKLQIAIHSILLFIVIVVFAGLQRINDRILEV